MSSNFNSKEKRLIYILMCLIVAMQKNRAYVACDITKAKLMSLEFSPNAKIFIFITTAPIFVMSVIL